MNIHVQNIGECQKCSIALMNFLISDLNKNRFNFTDDPTNCDVLIILGCLSKTQFQPLINFWKKMPRKHIIISFGYCGTGEQDLFSLKEDGFINQAIVKDDLAEILPIDYIIEGCPPTLEKIGNLLGNIKI
ncbi:MAG: hypothetical protein ACTSQG_11145 [Promethearchaeota archaeon]